ncbi:MAG: guanylate kinase [Dehalococcoidales bacterium]|nr:guanylate kinase [Dehalococcoidales bacterium]
MKEASPKSPPLLIVISGPSGVGKDAILDRLKESGYPLKYITTMTTRSRRPGELNDVDYHFVSKKRFQEMIENGELLEWANVYGNWYGVPREDVKQALDRGEDTIVKVDIQGAAAIKKMLPQVILIFLMPPTMNDLLRRLSQRRTESPSDLDLRLKTAEEEIKQLPLFDYVVMNRGGEVNQAVTDILAILTAEKCRATPRKVAL